MPTGAFPFRLDLTEVLPPADVEQIRAHGRLIFHTARDTGGVKNPASQQIVALRLEDDFAGDAGARPSFFYNLARLQSELAAAPDDAALIVALHHLIYSADAHHGGSERMGEALDGALAATGSWPHLILTGQVHDYQRFTRRLQGRELPSVVAGAGDYWHLRYMARNDDGSDLQVPWQVPDSEVTLEAYRDDRHGFLRLTAAPGQLHGEYISVHRPQEPWRHDPVNTDDVFTIDVAAHTVTTG